MGLVSLQTMLVCQAWNEVLTFRRVLVFVGRMVRVLASILILAVQ